jgi:hypothetical protein
VGQPFDESRIFGSLDSFSDVFTHDASDGAQTSVRADTQFLTD